MGFEKDGYEVLRNVIDQQLLLHLKTEFELIRDIKFFTENENNFYAFGDRQAPKSFSYYSATCFETLSMNLNSKMNEITGKELNPTYTFARIYYNGSILEPHIDRPSCEYSVTICIDSTSDWDFCIKNRKNETVKILLNPGDMCVYSGCELEHWRDAYRGEKHIQCFLHYVDSLGSYKDYKFDKRPLMGLSDDSRKKSNFLYN